MPVISETNCKWMIIINIKSLILKAFNVWGVPRQFLRHISVSVNFLQYRLKNVFITLKISIKAKFVQILER